MTEAEAASPLICTIGHSNHPLAAFLGLLEAYGIEVIVDARSAPYSRYTPHFNKESLKASLAEQRIKYLFMGEELGGRPRDPECYDEQGHVLYGKVAASASFRRGIARVEKGVREYRVALLCAEENPAGCHRKLLVARVLARQGVAVRHIRGDGLWEPEEDPERSAGQLALFGEEETEGWRSIRSVSPGRPRPSSSER